MNMRMWFALGALASLLAACAQAPPSQPLLGFPIFGSAAETPPPPAPPPPTTAAIPPPKQQAAQPHPKPAVKKAAAPKTTKPSKKVILVKATPKGPCGAHDQSACKATTTCAWREPHVRSDGAIVAGYCHAPEAKQ
jgi:hypothetical protein